ncbi:hypothetical protein ORS3428_27480 [Mesorhizobium sp. ORS 3428]|nr:hypothetical protein ORS3428_27480 [Mesorhizobium sp. ORS 3428]
MAKTPSGACSRPHDIDTCQFPAPTCVIGYVTDYHTIRRRRENRQGVGATSLSGVKGSIIGTLLGAGDNCKAFAIGLVIGLAVILDAYREKLLRKIRQESRGDQGL